MTLPLFETLAEAREKLMNTLGGSGTHCPCCDQFVKLYKRKLNSTMAAGVCWLATESGVERQWVSVSERAPRWVVSTRQLATVEHWGLIESKPNVDESKRCSGIWRITLRGVRFVRGEIGVPKHVYLYNARLRGFSDEWTTVHEALGDAYDYAELMGRRS